MRWSLFNVNARWQGRALMLLLILALAFAVRALNAQFIGARLTDASWFQWGSYAIFDRQAQNILDGKESFFWINDPSRTEAAIYPPGYPMWLALVYRLSGARSSLVVQSAQWVLDALSVLLIVGITVTGYGWRAGLAAGALAALSPLLALSGATPLADAPTSWIVLGGVWMLLLAAERRSFAWAFGAGLMVGASCWLRANALLLAAWWMLAMILFVRATWRERARLMVAIAFGAALAIAPIVIRNAVAFRAFAPTGLGLGTNLWEGIGETERAAEFGAVYGDEALIAQERAALGLAPDAPLGLYWPDGVQRDRQRTHKALAVISRHPVWYACVMARRAWGMLKYAGEPAPFRGSAGINVTSEKCLPPSLRKGALAFVVNFLGMVQSVLRWLLLPLIACGVWLALRRNACITGLILTTALYYLLTLSMLHSEIRYGLPMQAVLIVFAGLSAQRLIEMIPGVKTFTRKSPTRT